MSIRQAALFCALALGACHPDEQGTTREAGHGPSPVVLLQAAWTDARGQPKRTSVGSGFVVSDAGHVVTAYHVIENYERLLEEVPPGHEIALLALPGPAGDGAGGRDDPTRAAARALVRVADDPANDLALLRASDPPIPALAEDAGRPPFGVAHLALGPLELGTPIALTGYPFGEHALTRRPGHLISSSALGKSILTFRQPPWFEALRTGSFLLAEVETHFGNSGGPVSRADSRGVIGMCSAILSMRLRQPGADGASLGTTAALFTLVIPTRAIVELLDAHGVAWHVAH